MKNLILLLIIFIIIVFNNCETSKDEFYLLKESNRSSLKSGDTLVYYDNNNQTDTLFVYSRIKGVIKEPLTGSCKAPYSYYDIDLVYFIKKRKSTDDLFIPTCEYLKDRNTFGSCWSGYECDKTIFIAIIAHENNLNIEFPYLFWYGYIVGKADTVMTNCQVSEKKYENVFYFKIKEPFKVDSLTELYYSNSYGIIQMNFFNGKTLKLKTHEKRSLYSDNVIFNNIYR